MIPKNKINSILSRAMVLTLACALAANNTWATDGQKAEKPGQGPMGEAPISSGQSQSGAPESHKGSLVQRVKPMLVLAGGLLLSAGALAARVIGDGGGEVEMRALTFAAEIPQWFKFCTLSSNPCELSSVAFRAVIDAVSSNSGRLPPLVKFSYEPNASMVVDREKNLIEVPAAQSDVELRGQLLLAFTELYAVAPATRDRLTQELMQNLFAHSKTERQESLIDDRHKLVVFVMPDRVVPTIGVNDEIIDFTENLRFAVRCPLANRWTSMTIHIRQSAGFVAEVSGVCENQNFTAKVFVKTNSQEVSTWSIRTFAVQNTGVSSELANGGRTATCIQNLIDRP